MKKTFFKQTILTFTSISSLISCGAAFCSFGALGLIGALGVTSGISFFLYNYIKLYL